MLLLRCARRPRASMIDAREALGDQGRIVSSFSPRTRRRGPRSLVESQPGWPDEGFEE